MAFVVILAPEAVEDLGCLSANMRATVRGALLTHLGSSYASRKRTGVKEVPLSEMKDLSRYLREAETQEIVITRHSKPAGILIGFESEEDWFDYRLENDPRFLRRIEQARSSLQAGRGIRLEVLKRNSFQPNNSAPADWRRLQPQLTMRWRSSQYGLRNSRLRILPAPDSGSGVCVTSTLRGHL